MNEQIKLIIDDNSNRWLLWDLIISAFLIENNFLVYFF